MSQKIVIRNVFLNALTYDYCYNLPTETIKGLNIKYRRMLATQAKAKAWCENSSIDEKIHFFHAIGLSTAFTIFPDKVKSGISLKEILQKYEKERLSQAQKEQASLGCYVTTDKESAFLLSLMGMTINSESYIKALEYNKTGYSIKNWGKKLDSPKQSEGVEVIDNVKVVANTILNAGLTFDSVKQLFEINDIEAKVLLFFYNRTHTYQTREDAYAYFSGYITRARVLRAIKKLILNDYLKKHLDWRTGKLTISTKGINTTSEFINRIIKQNQF